MHRTFVRDLHQLAALPGVERTFHADDPIDLVEHPGFGFTLRAVFGVDLAVLQRHRDPLQRQRFALGIQAHGHRCAGAEAGQHEIIRPKPGVLAAGRNRLIGQQMVWPHRDGLLEFAVAGLTNHHAARRLSSVGNLLGRDRIEVARGPRGDDVGDVGGIASLGQQVIRARQRHEALGVLGRDKDTGRIVDADGIVGRRVHDQQRLVQLRHMIHQIVLGDVVEKLASDMKRPARQRDFDLAVLADVLDAIREQAGHMRRIGRCGDGDDGPGVRNLRGRGQYRGAAEAMADQDRGAFSDFPQMVGGPHQIGDI